MVRKIFAGKGKVRGRKLEVGDLRFEGLRFEDGGSLWEFTNSSALLTFMLECVQEAACFYVAFEGGDELAFVVVERQVGEVPHPEEWW